MEPVAGGVRLRPGGFVGRQAAPQFLVRRRALDAGGLHVRRMRAVDLALMDLRPVGGYPHLEDRHLGVLLRGKGGGPKFRHVLDLAQPGPNKAAPLLHRVGTRLDFVNQRAAFGFGLHGDDIAVHVHFSAMIEAE